MPSRLLASPCTRLRRISSWATTFLPENGYYAKEYKEEGYWTTVYTNPYVVAYNSRMVGRENLPRDTKICFTPCGREK